MQYLLANHVIEETKIGIYKQRAIAKVVLSKILFVENNSSNSSLQKIAARGEYTETLFSNPIL
jgi:hypothetical protein